MPTSETISTTADDADAPEMQVVPPDDAPLYCFTMSRGAARGALVMAALLTVVAGWIAFAVLDDDDTTFGTAFPMIVATLVMLAATLTAWKNLRWLQQDPAPVGKLVPVPVRAPRGPSRKERAAAAKAARATRQEQPAEQLDEQSGGPSDEAVGGRGRLRFRARRAPASSVAAPAPDAVPVRPASTVQAPIRATTATPAPAPTATPAPAPTATPAPAPTVAPAPAPAPVAGLGEPPATPVEMVAPDTTADTSVAEPIPGTTGHTTSVAEPTADTTAAEPAADATVAEPAAEPVEQPSEAGDWFAPVLPPAGHGMGPAPASPDDATDVADDAAPATTPEAESGPGTETSAGEVDPAPDAPSHPEVAEPTQPRTGPGAARTSGPRKRMAGLRVRS